MTKINTSDIINNIIETNNYGKIKVLSYDGKEKDHMYTVIFLNTNNKQQVSRSSIKRHSCVDEQKKKENHKLLIKNKIIKRKKMNKTKEQDIIYTNKKLFKTLALDQSTTGTAYSIYIDKQLIKYGKIDTKDYEDSIFKIIKIRNEINKIITEENIDLLVIEDIYMGYNVHTFKILSILYGILEILSIEKNILFLSQVPYNWKKGVGISLGVSNNDKKRRDKQKESSVDIVNRKFGLSIKDNDISDSILIGYHTVNNCIKEQNYIENIWS